MAYGVQETGSKYASSYRVYLKKDGKAISPFHDVPLMENEYYNVINEIPRFEHAKFEITKDRAMNPIAQDIKKGNVRYVKNVYPFYGYPFNYGALPQTWEDPTVEDDVCKANGDNDPIDVCEIGSRCKYVGEVYQAKVLGAIGLLDDGEADWKIIVLDTKDVHAGKINSLDDAKTYYPGVISDAIFWFENYKIPDGKPKNQFIENGKVYPADFAKEIIRNGNASWKRLIKQGHAGIDAQSMSLNNFVIEGQQEKAAEKPAELLSYAFVSNNDNKSR